MFSERGQWLFLNAFAVWWGTLKDQDTTGALQYVLKKKGINYLQVSRTKRNGIISYAELTQEILETHTLVINTSPLGMYPAVEEAPEIPYDCLGERHYLYDLVYNPAKTRFLAEGERRGAVIENGADDYISRLQNISVVFFS